MGLIRLFLAAIVVVDHWRLFVIVPHGLAINDHYIRLGFNAGYAVVFFYVISGFLIRYTLHRNYDRGPVGAARFYRSRFVRIFSLYWPVVALTFLSSADAWNTFQAAPLLDKWTGFFLIGIDWRIAMADYPDAHWGAAISLLPQAWTLGAELTFYLTAPLLMRSWRLPVALLIISALVRLALLVLGASQQWTYLFPVPTFCFFMLGFLVAGVRGPLLQPGLGGVLLGCSVAAMALGDIGEGFNSPRFYASLVLFVAALPGVFEASRKIAWMNAAGDLSYPVYLLHMPILYLSGTWLLAATTGSTFVATVLLSSAVFLLITAALAMVLHWTFEKPCARAMKWALGSNS